MATAYNVSDSPAVSLQESTAGSRSVVTWRRGQPEQDVPEVASWWLPTLLRRRGLWWASDAFSRDDAGAFALGLFFCAAVGFLFGAGEPSQLGVPILPPEARQAAARATAARASGLVANSGLVADSGPRLVVTDQASVRAGARTLGEQQERQRRLVTLALTPAPAPTLALALALALAPTPTLALALTLRSARVWPPARPASAVLCSRPPVLPSVLSR